MVGVSLLDGYPDYLRLLGYTDAQVTRDKARVCGILQVRPPTHPPTHPPSHLPTHPSTQVARAFDAVGLVRPIYMGKQSFEPAGEERRQASTYTNGHNWDAQWRVYCRAQAPDPTSYLSTAAEASSPEGHGTNPDHRTSL